jgi:hypothetical protein
MKNNFMNFFGILAIASISIVSCTKDATGPNEADTSLSLTTTGVEPVLLSGSSNGGNVTCSEAASAAGLEGYEYTTGKQDYPFNSNSFGDNVTVSTDGTYVSWSITPPAGMCVSNVAVIVKGGPSANVYYYNNGETSDSGLASPVNSSGNPAGLSNLTICYNLVACETSCTWQEETAYAGDIAGAGSAWWFALDASVSGSYPIYAGQEVVEGASVTYNAATDMITINLGNNMQLQDVNEPVKVEGYNTLPSSRPAAGLFQLYKGSNLVVQGNGSAYYVVHLDVEVCN